MAQESYSQWLSIHSHTCTCKTIDILNKLSDIQKGIY